MTTREGKRTCRRCKKTVPLAEFYENDQCADGRMTVCRACNNDRPPTEARLIRTRARNRAYAELVERHRAEFQDLLDAHTEDVAAELERLRAAAAAERDEDVDLPRLKPGPRRRDEPDVVKRLDVARCPACHRHHDAGHTCESCGARPDTLDGDLDLDQVAIERRLAGDLSIALNRNEEAEVARLWAKTGRSIAECERVTGVDAQYFLVTLPARKSGGPLSADQTIREGAR